MVVKVCPIGHLTTDSDPVWCDECGDIVDEWTPMDDPDELMTLAEREIVDENRYHHLADAALHARMKTLDPAFAARWLALYKRGFWYS